MELGCVETESIPLGPGNVKSVIRVSLKIVLPLDLWRLMIHCYRFVFILLEIILAKSNIL